MPETGHTWQKAFKGHPIEAAHVRSWTLGRVTHPDAPLVASELFVAVLGSGATAMTLSTAGTRIRVIARGDTRLPVLTSHGPGRQLLAGLCTRTGLTTDECGLWGQLGIRP